MKSKIKKRLLLALALFFTSLIFFPSGAGAEGGYVPVAIWGSYGTGDGYFKYPFGIATDGAGYVYVADTSNHRIQKFDSDGNFICKWGSSGDGDGYFKYPFGIATDGADNVYVADTLNNRIQKFDSDGTFISTWGSPGTEYGDFNMPYGIATDASDNVYVADTDNDRIQKFESDGTFSTQWGSYGTGDGYFKYPFGIATDGAGYVYVADTSNNRIQKFDSDGTFISTWGSPGTGEGQFDWPYGIATDASGNVYVADTDNDRIQKFESDGTFITQWGSSFRYPCGIATDASGNVYVADTDNHRIQKFSPDTTRPWVESVTLNPPSPVKAGLVTFTIVFSEDMDTSALPTVTFGKAGLYNEHTISETSYSGKTWKGKFTMEAGYDGEQHISISGAKDPAGNPMDPDPDTNHTFLVDTTKPTVTMTNPSEDQTVSNASYTIEGEAYDNGGSGIAKVEVIINDGSTWNDAKDTNPWSYVATLVAGANVVKARSSDKAGNVSDETPGITLTYETDKPTLKSLTLNPPSPVKAGEVTFSIVFSEQMNITISPTVTFGRKDSYDEHTIEKTDYSADTWVGEFTIGTGYDGEQHISISDAQDLADNLMDTDSSHTFLVDTTSPAGSILINGGAGYTNSRSVTLSFNASSSSASLSLANISPSWMRFKNEDSSWSSWESCSSSKSWTLSSGDGKKTVYVEFKDSVGNVSKTYSGSIILHRTPPTVAITSPCAESCLKGEVTVEGTATDDYFEKYEIEFAEGLYPCSCWHQITSCCFAVVEAELCCWNVNSLSDGTYTLKLTAWDLASNFAEVKVVLKVDNHPPQTTLTEYPLKKVTGNTPKAVVPFSWIGSDADDITPVEKLVYQCRLEGHSTYQDWSGWSKDSTSTFVLPSGGYTFKVRAKDEAGNYPAEDDSETARYSFTVSLPLIIYPNPCYLNQAGFLTFSNLPLESEVRIYIYDLAGSLVRILGETDAVIQGGSKVATWNLKNDNGEMLTRGIYLYYILNATEKRSGKIAIIN
ncbi:hypothetical protein CEE34_11600 [Candidatus Aerophobetes bacterium Ae_b3a]|nr:MAG: hypothetical protein CEE34_11600 [Candidatus Aerophobetes bacterium Ae_b3a]